MKRALVKWLLPLLVVLLLGGFIARTLSARKTEREAHERLGTVLIESHVRIAWMSLHDLHGGAGKLVRSFFLRRWIRFAALNTTVARANAADYNKASAR